ncbi:MAG: cation transporter [Polyangiaceae bacterium]
MEDCCQTKAQVLEPLRERQARVIRLLFAANAGMFLVECGFGVVARSTALLGDSLDMFGDALVYAATLHVLNRSLRSKAMATLLKGSVLTLLGLAVLVEAALKLTSASRPEPLVMGWIGGLALAVNVGCLLLLVKYRDHDINMSSAWICSRNDIIANGAVLASAGSVAHFGATWPDIVIGAGIAVLFLWSAANIMKSGLEALRQDGRVSRKAAS